MSPLQGTWRAHDDCEKWAAQIEDHIQTGDRSDAAKTLLERAASTEEIARLRAYSPDWNQIQRAAHTVPREIRSLIPMPRTRFDDIALPVLLLAGARSQTYPAGQHRASCQHAPGRTYGRTPRSGSFDPGIRARAVVQPRAAVHRQPGKLSTVEVIPNLANRDED